MAEQASTELCAYQPEHFIIQEFVPPQTYALFGARSWLAMDVRIVWTADAVREYFKKPVTINTWHNGGQFSARGYRLPTVKTLDDLTQHKMGRAIDFDVKGIAAEEVRKEIIAHPTEFYFRFIRRLELNVNWVHADCALTNSDKIITFNP